MVERAKAPVHDLTGTDRVLATLRALADRPEGAGLHELATKLGSPKSSVHRALAALRRAGLVDQDHSGRYWLGWDFLQLAFSYYDRIDDVSRVRPAMTALAEHFGETVHYATLDRAETVYRAKVQPPGAKFQMTSVVGGRNPAHCTGLGKALLAYTLRDRRAVQGYVAANGPLVARTENTLTSAAELSRDFAEIRTRGFAIDREESEHGIVCVAFPLFLASKSVPTGAISITAVAHRLPLDKLETAVDEVREIVWQEVGAVLQ
jgi:IclR family transcriptional regulator, acetate operon repressor